MGKNKTIILAEKEAKYLKEMIKEESEKFEIISKQTSDPEIQDEFKILSNIKKVLL